MTARTEDTLTAADLFARGSTLAARLYDAPRPFDITLAGVVCALGLPETTDSIIAVGSRWHDPLAGADGQPFAIVLQWMRGVLKGRTRHLAPVRGQYDLRLYQSDAPSYATVDAVLARELKVRGVRRGTKRYRELWAELTPRAEAYCAERNKGIRAATLQVLTKRAAEQERETYTPGMTRAAALRQLAADVIALAGGSTTETAEAQMRVREIEETITRARAEWAGRLARHQP